MSDVSEHSDSEFYNPGELSEKELLQQPTYSTEKKKSQKVKTSHTDEEVFIQCPPSQEASSAT